MQQISQNPRIQADYEEMVTSGQSHNMAELLAFQQCPGIQTDTRLAKGMHTGDQFDKNPISRKIGEQYRRKAERAGVSTVGKQYVGGVAKEVGDPEAWIDPSNYRGDVRRICEKRGWECDGSVKVKGREQDIDTTPFIAEDIVQEEYESRIEKEFGGGSDLTQNEKVDLKEKVRDEIGPPKDGA